MMKKLMTLAISAVMVCSLAACGDKGDTKDQVTPTPNADSTPKVEIANPFVDCKTADEAAGIAGFTVTLPESTPSWVSDTQIRAVKDSMIEVIYSGADNELRIRKASGTEDASGEYGNYATVEELTVGDIKVSAKGDAGKVHVATWTDGNYAFSISVTDGMTKDELTALVSAVA